VTPKEISEEIYWKLKPISSPGIILALFVVMCYLFCDYIFVSTCQHHSKETDLETMLDRGEDKTSSRKEHKKKVNYYLLPWPRPPF
jgi:hypothetical protein